MKTSDNTHISEIDRFIYPATSTMIDRYVLASHWTKTKTVLDAATGYGYGAGILQSLGAMVSLVLISILMLLPMRTIDFNQISVDLKLVIFLI